RSSSTSMFRASNSAMCSRRWCPHRSSGPAFVYTRATAISAKSASQRAFVVGPGRATSFASVSGVSTTGAGAVVLMILLPCCVAGTRARTTSVSRVLEAVKQPLEVRDGCPTAPLGISILVVLVPDYHGHLPCTEGLDELEPGRVLVHVDELVLDTVSVQPSLDEPAPGAHVVGPSIEADLRHCHFLS